MQSGSVPPAPSPQGIGAVHGLDLRAGHARLPSPQDAVRCCTRRYRKPSSPRRERRGRSCASLMRFRPGSGDQPSGVRGWITPELARIASAHDALTDAGLAPEQVERVFLTGGTSLVPAARRLFDHRFGLHQSEPSSAPGARHLGRGGGVARVEAERQRTLKPSACWRGALRGSGSQRREVRDAPLGCRVGKPAA